MNFEMGVLLHKLLKKSENTPVELVRLWTGSWPLQLLTVPKETKQPQGKEGLHMVQMGKLRKRHPLRATASELCLWVVNCQWLRDNLGEIAQCAWNNLIFCSYFLLLFFCSWSLLENIWQQPVLLFLQSHVKLTKAKREMHTGRNSNSRKLWPNKRE